MVISLVGRASVLLGLLGLPYSTEAPAAGPGPLSSIDGLWRYSHVRCPGGDAVPEGYSQVLVVQQGVAAVESAVEGCASQTRLLTVRWTPEGPVLVYRGAQTVCTPGPTCFGGFRVVVGGRVTAATYACSSGPTYGESGPYVLAGPDTLETQVPGERGCTAVYTRVPGPTG